MPHTLTLTEKAAKRILHIIEKDNMAPNTCLRLRVDGGGCSGMQYAFSLDADQKDEDMMIEAYGARVLIDDISMTFLQDSEIDYVEDMTKATFVINNPNAASSCGCGNSFSI